MSLKDKSCEKCHKGFEDGQILLKNNNKLYHHIDGMGIPAPIFAIVSCSHDFLDGNQKIGAYYKGKFYDFEKNGDKLKGMPVELKSMYLEEDSIPGHKIVSDLSFLTNLEPDP